MTEYIGIILAYLPSWVKDTPTHGGGRSFEFKYSSAMQIVRDKSFGILLCSGNRKYEGLANNAGNRYDLF
jgi:hypothetical protein